MDRTSELRLGEGRYGESQYQHVYADSKARFSTPFGSRRPICYGDRLFARIMMRGRTVLEFVVNQVSDLTELWGELRKKAKGLRGLVQVHIRNYSRGWSMEQPMMLYASVPAGSSRVTATASMATAPSRASYASASSTPRRTMLFPWETH